MIKIGVISDTHYPDRVPYLPYDEITTTFRGCDAIIHAGDLETFEVIHELEKIAPVHAVRGDDEADIIDLPEKRILDIGGVRIGIHHSHRPYILELPSRLAGVLRLRRGVTWAGIHEWLLRQFKDDDVQVIVFGHFHMTYSAYHDGTLFFNPGSIYKLSTSALRWRSKNARSRLRRFAARIEVYLQSAVQQTHTPSIGLITIGNGTIKTEHIEVSQIDHDQYL